jgi:hypothetical protein
MAQESVAVVAAGLVQALRQRQQVLCWSEKKRKERKKKEVLAPMTVEKSGADGDIGSDSPLVPPSDCSTVRSQQIQKSRLR